jgi:hypothetical protein
LFEGLSLSEVVSLRTGDVDPQSSRVLGMPVSIETLEAIQEHLQIWEIQGGSYLIPKIVKGGRVTDQPITSDGLKKLIYQTRDAYTLPLPMLRSIRATVITGMFEGLSVGPLFRYKSLRNLRKILARRSSV